MMMSEGDMLDQALKTVRYNGFQMEKVGDARGPTCLFPAGSAHGRGPPDATRSCLRAGHRQ